MRSWLALACLFYFTGCSHGASEMKDLEELEDYPLRPATKEEANELRTCLKSAWKEQTAHFEETGSYYSKFKSIPTRALCKGFKMRMGVKEDKFEILAQLNSGDNSVRWTINETGTMEEYLEPDDDMEDAGF